MLALVPGTRGLLQPRPYLAAGAFTGSVRHHEGDVQRLKRLYEVVKSTRQQMSGCMDPSAANYDPNAANDDGTCNYLFQDEVSGTKVEGVREWLPITSCRMHKGSCLAALCAASISSLCALLQHCAVGVAQRALLRCLLANYKRLCVAAPAFCVSACTVEGEQQWCRCSPGADKQLCGAPALCVHCSALCGSGRTLILQGPAQYVKQPINDQQLYVFSLTPWAPLLQKLVDFVNSTLRNVWTTKVRLTDLPLLHHCPHIATTSSCSDTPNCCRETMSLTGRERATISAAAVSAGGTSNAW